MTIEKLRARLAELQGTVRSLADAETLTPEQETELDEALAEFDARSTELNKLETRASRVAAVKGATTGAIEGAPSFSKTPDKVNPTDVRSLSRKEVREAALRLADEEAKHLTERQRRHLDAVLRSNNEDTDGSLIGRRLLLTETDAYRSGWQKHIAGHPELLNADEQRALSEYRAMNEGTGSQGGYGVPVLIDPTIILTSQAADAPILDVCRVVTITTDAWKGVTSAGMSWGYGSESSVVADGTPALAQPSIPVSRATGFIPYSIEVEQDYPGFAEEMSALLASGYLDLIANATLNGSGSAPTPTGIFTALTASSGAQVQTATAGTIGAVDVTSVFGAQLERFRSKSTWLMNVATENAIRTLSTGGPGGTFTVDLAQPGVQSLMGKRVLLSDYAPKQPTGTTAGVFVAVGDFSHFVFVQRAGMTVEPVQHLFDTSTGRPNGQRGRLAWSRHGFNVTDTNAFRGLANNT